MSDVAAPAPLHNDAKAKRIVLILVWAQAVLGAQMPVHFILGGLIGKSIAADPTYATLPISMTVLVTMFAAPTMSWIMGIWGRRTGFLLGGMAGVGAMLLATHAISTKDFTLFCIASGILGIYMGAHGFYRFAAADMASDGFRPKAISWVMAGGLLSALLGPQLVKEYEDWLAPIPYAGAYQIMAIVGMIGIIPLLFLDIPLPKKETGRSGQARSWSQILSDRKVVVAMLCAMVVYALMNLVMTSTPLAMIDCGFGTADAADVVRIHVLLMFLPSFFTGHLVAKFGAPKIMALGLAILTVCSFVSMSGITLTHFNVALGLLGIGWNFGFIGATALLTSAHTPQERARVQGLNDFLVFGLVTVASFGSGALMDSVGWTAVNVAMLPALAIAAIALAWLALKNPKTTPA
ncbi:MAG: MFS transporter [Pseudomonadota bacterium]